jgi:hypothetical protein
MGQNRQCYTIDFTPIMRAVQAANPWILSTSRHGLAKEAHS